LIIDIKFKIFSRQLFNSYGVGLIGRSISFYRCLTYMELVVSNSYIKVFSY